MPKLPLDLTHEATWIALTSDCQVTALLRNAKLRQEAFPLDWVLIPYPGILQALQQRFQGWLDDLVFGPLKKQQQDRGDGIGLKSQALLHPAYGPTYHQIFLHDFPDREEKTLQTVREKYQRRIDRLFQKLEGSDYLIFVLDSKNLGAPKLTKNYQRIQSINSHLSPEFPEASTDSNWLDPSWLNSRLEAWLDQTYPELKYSFLQHHQIKKKLKQT